MSINFATLKGMEIPEGKVKSIFITEADGTSYNVSFSHPVVVAMIQDTDLTTMPLDVTIDGVAQTFYNNTGWTQTLESSSELKCTLTPPTDQSYPYIPQVYLNGELVAEGEDGKALSYSVNLSKATHISAMYVGEEYNYNSDSSFYTMALHIFAYVITDKDDILISIPSAYYEDDKGDICVEYNGAEYGTSSSFVAKRGDILWINVSASRNNISFDGLYADLYLSTGSYEGGIYLPYIVCGDVSFSVSYRAESTGSSSEASVNIYEGAYPVSLDIISPPTKTAYKSGEDFDTTGMVVQATYSDGSTKIVDDYYFYADIHLGTESVSINYSDKNQYVYVDCPITVTEGATAVYFSDGSLIFYKDSFLPTAGQTYKGKTVVESYAADGRNAYPWNSSSNQSYNATSVSFDASLKGYKFSKVTSLASWFKSMTSLKTASLVNLDVTNITTINSLFYKCTSLTTIDMSGCDTSNVTNMAYAFRECSALTTIYASEHWSTASVTSSSYMFRNCTNLVGAIKYSSSKTNATYANYTTGYFTYKAAT